MKILLVNSVFGVGSTGRICAALRDFVPADNDEYDCRAACGRSGDGADCRFSTPLSVAFDGLSTRLFDGCGTHSDAAYVKLRRYIEEFQPDAVHLHNLHGYYINAYRLLGYLKESGIPTLLTLHDTFWLTGHCAFLYSDCDGWKTGCGGCAHLREYPKTYARDDTRWLWQLKKAAFEGFDTLSLTCPSRWLLGLLPGSLLSGIPAYYIKNGVDTSVFRPGEYICGEKLILFGAANDWGAHKGLADFIALRGLLDDKYEIRLAGLDKNAKLPRGMTALGRLSAKQMADEYRGSYAFVSLSGADNAPTTVCEALCCGTPAITYATGGCGELLTAGAGITVPAGDVKAAAEAVKTLDRAGASTAALEESKQLGTDRFCRETYALYEKIICENGKR